MQIRDFEPKRCGSSNRYAPMPAFAQPWRGCQSWIRGAWIRRNDDEWSGNGTGRFRTGSNGGGSILRRVNQFAGVLAILACSLTGARAQQSRVYRDGNSWVEEKTGTLPVSKSLRLKVTLGSVRVRGGASAISYTIRSRVNTGSEQEARKMFEKYEITSGTRGDSAWVTGEWSGRWPRKFSGDVVLNVPREMESVKIETQCGNIDVSEIAGNFDGESGGGT